MCNLNNSYMSLTLISSDIFPTCNISTSLLRLAEYNSFWFCFVVSDDDDDNDDDDNPGDVAVDVDSILLFIQEVLPVV